MLVFLPLREGKSAGHDGHCHPSSPARRTYGSYAAPQGKDLTNHCLATYFDIAIGSLFVSAVVFERITRLRPLPLGNLPASKGLLHVFFFPRPKHAAIKKSEIHATLSAIERSTRIDPGACCDGVVWICRQGNMAATSRTSQPAAGCVLG